MQKFPNGPSEITIFAKDRAQRDDSLEAAVTSLVAKATALRAGILVTRKSPQSFTVAVSSTVPFGMTKELDEALQAD